MARISRLLEAGRTLSFEFFPPKTPSAQMTLGRTVAALEQLEPNFVSVTYGAGGSDRHRTGDVVNWMLRETDIDPMAHLTCRGHTRDDVAALLVEYRRIGVENILALGGDPPADGRPEA
ncbi:MAG: methylenetetrahydrofolate reductase, partial [Acidimicrobiia bacterium]|nr:methylenetetrahydrofolate reductase [Acidimicrobiia bacterium]